MEGKNLVLLDGGTATQLVILGHPDLEYRITLYGHLLFCREALIQFWKCIKTGSDIILTVSYQATVSGFMKHADLTEGDAIHLLQLSVKLAKQASDQYSRTERKAKVAGSMGPVGVQYADGSEYTGNYVDDMDEKEIQDMHRPQIKALLEAGVDLLAFETVPAMKEASAIVNLLEKEFPDARAWLTFSCKNGLETCYGDTFYSAVKAVYQSDSIVAVGVNCTDPVFVTSLLKSIQSLNVCKPIIVKPNSGEVWDANINNWTDKHKCVDISSKVEEWIENGAQWIGGCCRVYADSIAKIRQILDKHE